MDQGVTNTSKILGIRLAVFSKITTGDKWSSTQVIKSRLQKHNELLLIRILLFLLSLPIYLGMCPGVPSTHTSKKCNNHRSSVNMTGGR